MSYKDHFSGHASSYSKYRPVYPPKLFEFLNSIVSNHENAWDCATGSGQAAIALSPFFKQIYASDASAEQIKHAVRSGNIEYIVASAEHSTIPDNSMDLITVAQAAHWFNHEKAYEEITRVAKANSIIAIWTYGLCSINEKIDSLLLEYYNGIVGPYWPPERKYIDDKYETLPFPFEKIKTPQFKIENQWNWEDMKNYLMTWSATQRFIKDKGDDPIESIDSRMQVLWRDKLEVVWPIYLLVGRV